eukprot:GFYU01006135.1.p1 GENE.GFYU01006135.1~~GFYU01006135.1.p1  ORF type:complete len:534 (-),score=199.34 GFYU01006135.1:26-1627(-)
MLSRMAINGATAMVAATVALVLVVSSVTLVSGAGECLQLKGFEGMCACTSDHCDTVDPVGELDLDTVVVYQTSKGGDRLKRSTQKWEGKNKGQHYTIKFDYGQQFQKIQGFGGAFTDSASINTHALTEDLQQKVLESYFGEDGIQYSLGRINIAACDFSTHHYTYDEVDGDFDLEHFDISMDITENKKIPFIKSALAMTSRPLWLFGSPWSPPTWMKTDGELNGGRVKGEAGNEYHKVWAKYMSRFVTEYKAQGINVDALTVQNEPELPPLIHKAFWESCWFTPEEERDFIKKDLGPILRADHPDLKIIMMDDQRSHLPKWIDGVLSDPEAAQYVDGVGVHWYAAVEDYIPGGFKKMTEAHNKHPEKFILPTEACEGYLPWSKGPKYGDWKRGETYGYDILWDLENFAVGWTDWNLVLDMKGGPNHANNNVDAPILADTEKGNVFYKQPMYYYMGHFSKFIPAESIRIKTESKGFLLIPGLEATSFVTPEGNTVLVVLNRDFTGRDFSIQEGKRYINASIPAHAIQTYVFKTR